MKVGTDWQRSANGTKTSGSASSCAAAIRASVRALDDQAAHIVYQASSGGAETAFVLSTKPRPAGSQANAPAIADAGLTADNTGQNPTLTYGTPGQGSIARIEFQGLGANVNCPAPSGARIWQLQ